MSHHTRLALPTTTSLSATPLVPTAEPAGAVLPHFSESSGSRHDLASKIDRLSNLLSRGVINEAEFARAKSQLIEAVTKSSSSSSSSSRSSSKSAKHRRHGTSSKSTSKSSRRKKHRSDTTSKTSKSSKEQPFNVHVVPNKWKVARAALQAFQHSHHHMNEKHEEDDEHGHDVSDPSAASPVSDQHSNATGEEPLDTTVTLREPRHSAQRAGYGTFGMESHEDLTRSTPTTGHAPALPKTKRAKKKLAPGDAVRSIRLDVAANYNDVVVRCYHSSGKMCNDIEEAVAQANTRATVDISGAHSHSRTSFTTKLQRALLDVSAKQIEPHGFDTNMDITDNPCPDVADERKTVNPLDDLSFDWHWIDVCGRDDDNGRTKFHETIAHLTKAFGLCPSLLVDRDFDLVMPQIFEAASNDHQFLVVLRVANERVYTLDDSMAQLTNRWVIAIDIEAKVAMAIHRVDTSSFAVLRTQWRALMRQRIAFEEFLVKIIDDAVNTYDEALTVNSSLIDLCEGKLSFSQGHARPTFSRVGALAGPPAAVRAKIRGTFIDSISSPFLQELLRPSGQVTRGDMNRFLYHLHRRASVLHRVLSLTEAVLTEIFTELKLCSEDRAEQMCAHCSDLSAKSQEARDEAEHMLQMHIALVSFQTNELMRMLTQVSMFFAPLSFIAGVYGMNFVNMPELHYKYGYFVVLGIMATIAILVLYTYRWRLQL
jgi:Mg2+ and Co2+ transporter CorA